MNQPLKTFQISILVLLCVSCSTLTMAEERMFPQILSFPILFFSFVVTDKWNQFSLPNWAGTIAALVAFGASILELLGGGYLSRVFFASHLITYLLWVVLLQKKGPRSYWWLIAISAMQIALASVLTKSIFFGMGVFTYVFLVLWSLAIFSIYRASLRIQHAHAQAGSSTKSTTASSDAGSSSILSLSSLTSSPSSESGHSLLPSSSFSQGSIHLDPGEQWLNKKLVFGLVLISFLSIGMGMAFFTLTPRFWLGKTMPSAAAGVFDGPLGSPTTGYSEQVKLGSIGEILESREDALLVKAFHKTTNKKLDVEKIFQDRGYLEPLFRGSVFEHYVEGGEWRPSSSGGSSPVPSPNNSSQLEGIRLEVTQENLGTANLFSVPSGRISMRTYSGKEVLQSPTSGVSWLRGKKSPGGTIQYSVFLPPVAKQQEGNKIQRAHRHPTIPVSRVEYRTYLTWRYLSSLRQAPKDQLSKMASYAQKLVANEEKNRNQTMNGLDRALFLESHLKDSGKFTYTLKQEIIDPTIDPIEDFLFNRKSGHCEYYASALTLMLRSVGVPCRLVNGYKGGDYNPETGQLEVKQMYAHAWVEMFDYQNREWVILDSTPAASRAASVAAISSQNDFLSNIKHWFKKTWRKNFVSVEYETQDKEIYQPLKKKALGLQNIFYNFQEFVANFQLSAKEFFSSPRKWFSITGGAIVFFGLLFISLTAWSVKKVVQIVSQISIRKKGSTLGSQLSIPFYERFISLIRKRQKLLRESQQTPLEFAERISQKLTEQGYSPTDSEVPQPITDAFYRVRFGGETLNEQEQKELTTLLDKLELSLQEQH